MPITITLNIQPTADVNIYVENGLRSHVDTPLVTFTPLNWNASQNTSLDIPQDNIKMDSFYDATLFMQVTSTDLSYVRTKFSIALAVWDTNTGLHTCTRTYSTRL